MGVRRPRAAARFGRGMLRVRLVCLAACASALFLAGAATEAAAQPVVTAVRVAEPPAIDGLLADDAWRRAARLSAFVQTAPVEGAAATESTEVSIVYDGENLYVGIRARYAEPGLMRAPIARTGIRLRRTTPSPSSSTRFATGSARTSSR